MEQDQDIPHLKQDFWSHTKKAINNSEGKHHRHAVDVSRKFTLDLNDCMTGVLGAYRLKNHGNEATDSWTSTPWK